MLFNDTLYMYIICIEYYRETILLSHAFGWFNRDMQYGRRLYKICINLLLFLKYNHLILLLLTFRCCYLVKENDFEIVRKILHYLFYSKNKTTSITQLFIAKLTNSCCQDDNNHKNDWWHQLAYNNYVFKACLVEVSVMNILRSKWIFIKLCRQHITTNYIKQSSMKKFAAIKNNLNWENFFITFHTSKKFLYQFFVFGDIVYI